MGRGRVGKTGVKRRNAYAATVGGVALLASVLFSAPLAMASDSPSGPNGSSASAQPTATSTPTSGVSSTTTTSSPTSTATSTATPSPTGSATSTATPSHKPTPTPSKTPKPSPTTTSSPTAPPAGNGEASLSPAELAAQLAQAQELQAQLEASNAKLAAITAKMTQLSTQSSTALQALQTAQRNESLALQTASAQQARLTDLQARATDLHNQLTVWAREAYVSGGALARYQAYITALQATRTDQVGDSLFLINYVGESEDQAVQEAQTLVTVQQVVTAQANLAATQATAARAQAEQASNAVKVALDQQKALLSAEQAAQAGRLGQAALTQTQLANSHSAAAIAAAAELAAASAGKSTAGASCGKGATKAAVKGFANGQIPRSALCPIWGAPGQLLRADAAAAFTTMSKAYAQRFGQPICVTDSYRSYSQQVALYAEKPNLAARPGTSNHGWGVAVDLCGGIQSFGTVQHTWLFTHAPLFGWFHPAWAEPTGSRPEPWHWEFGG